jgi:AbrB family looped-hinge helix DNA binding protein
MITRISSKGRLLLPAELRRKDHVEAGQEFEIERLGAGEYLLVRREAPANQGLVDWLLACPEKGFFVPIEPVITDTP